MKILYFNQAEFEIRCEWGMQGIQSLAPGDAIVIVDVFSFTTSVDIALSRDARVHPFYGDSEQLNIYAQSVGAVVANASRTDPSGFSLAPSSLLGLQSGMSVVLPSPNGSRLSLATGNTPTFAGCLRNARAVAQATQSLGKHINLIPAGERWPDGSMRPGLEDLLGAGAVISFLGGRCSPEAEMAKSVFHYFQDRLFSSLAECASGKEVSGIGSMDDVRLAAELNASLTAPQLVDGAYR